MSLPAKKLRITILGSGTSTGVPVIGCECPVCTSSVPENRRTRSSVLITTPTNENVVIDTGPDFREQILRHRVKKLSAILYTHLHADHVNGLDDTRAFSFKSNDKIKTYVPEEFVNELQDRFPYIFKDSGYEGKVPQLDVIPIAPGAHFQVAGIQAESQRVPHGNIHTSVYRLARFVYATDFKTFPEELIAAWKGKISLMVASGIHFGQHTSHSVIPETVALMDRLGVECGIITHIAHNVDHFRDQKLLPRYIHLAYDGMTVDLDL